MKNLALSVFAVATMCFMANDGLAQGSHGSTGGYSQPTAACRCNPCTCVDCKCTVAQLVAVPVKIVAYNSERRTPVLNSLKAVKNVVTAPFKAVSKAVNSRQYSVRVGQPQYAIPTRSSCPSCVR